MSKKGISHESEEENKLADYPYNRNIFERQKTVHFHEAVSNNTYFKKSYLCYAEIICN